MLAPAAALVLFVVLASPQTGAVPAPGRFRLLQSTPEAGERSAAPSGTAQILSELPRGIVSTIPRRANRGLASGERWDGETTARRG